MAVTGACPKLIKYMLFLLAFLSMPLGIAITAAYTLASSDLQYLYLNVAFKQTLTIQIIIYVVIGLGVTLFIQGFILFLGTLYESKASFQLVLLITVISVFGQLGVGIYIGSQYNTDLNNMDQTMMTLLNRYPNESTEAVAIDYFQQTFSCCGWKNYTDWLATRWYQTQLIINVTNFNVPVSCCNVTSQPCQIFRNDFPRPCKESLSNHTSGKIQMVVPLVVSEFFLMVISLMLTGYFYSNMGREEYKYS